MFKLFGKKKEAAPQAQAPQDSQVQAFAQQFEAEEFTLLAVTGANGFSGGKSGDERLWTASIELTAWLDEDGDEVCRGSAQLVTLADDKLLEYLKSRVPQDFIIRAKVRQAKTGDSFQLLGLPEPGFDPDLKAILDEQKKPVSHYIEGLGTFTLNRSVNWFEANVDWLGAEIALDFDRDQDQAACAQTARALMADQSGWDQRVRAYAAGQLLELANDWARQEEGEEAPGEITQEQFISRMELESIQVNGDGGFEFWFNDGDLFWGHSIHVSGDLTQGPAGAQMEG